jgi:hypothetical protein
MITIDQLLLKIIQLTSPTIEELLEKKDARVLRSIGSIVAGPNFITENQSNLLLKILQTNKEKLSSQSDELIDALVLPSWSKVFRKIDPVKKMYISPGSDENLQIILDFTFSSSIRKKLQELSKSVSGLVAVAPGKLFVADLTEKNIVTLVDALTPLEFTIDENVQNFYKIIKSWSEEDIRNQFLLTTMTHTNFQKQITSDLGTETAIDENIINDRSMRYQYFHKKSKKIPENLVEIIANRPTPKVWVNKKETTIDEVLNSLVRLKRFPILVVFDSYNIKNSLTDLKNLTESLENIGIYKNVGIYFRLSNDADGKEFNQYIAEKQLNCNLDHETKVVGVQSGKIPKFLLKTDWKPMSVISIGTALRHSKTAAYANSCDLIISYTDTQPIVETKILWS